MARCVGPLLGLLAAILFVSVAPVDGQVCNNAFVCISNSVTNPNPYDPILPVGPAGADVDDILDLWRVAGTDPVGSEDGRRAWQELSLADGFPGSGDTPVVDLGDQVINGAGQLDLGPYLEDVEPEDWFEATGIIGAESCSSKACHWLDTPTIPPLNYPQLTLSDFELLSDVELHVALALLSSDPVDPSSGEFIMQSTDLAFPGFGIGFAHTRIYRSGLYYDGPMGFAWDHEYNRRILTVQSETCGAAVLYMTGQGSTLLFKPVSNDSEAVGGHVTVTTRYEPAPGIPLVLERVERSTIGSSMVYQLFLP